MPTNPTTGTPDSLPCGVDFGGSGIKAAPVDLAAGAFAADRSRIATPQPSTPDAVAQVLVELLGRFPEAEGPVGITVPGVVRHGVVHSAANIDESWLGTDADAVFTKATGRDVHVVNDADAAGLAEVRYGAARGRGGVVHRHHPRHRHRVGPGLRRRAGAELRARPPRDRRPQRRDPRRQQRAGEARSSRGSSGPKRLTAYYRTLEMLFSPDLFVVGGGVSKKSEEFLPLVDLDTEIVPATLLNKAGVVGAALYACEGGA